MHAFRSRARSVSFVRFALSVCGCVAMLLVVACGKTRKQDESFVKEGESLHIRSCDEYLSKMRMCALLTTDPKERKKRLESVEQDREEWRADAKKPNGPNMGSVCDSLMRLARSKESQEHARCPAIF